jgi:hypothetical protein
MTGGGQLAFAVAAAPDWWPVGCESLAPRSRTQNRAALRLVSSAARRSASLPSAAIAGFRDRPFVYHLQLWTRPAREAAIARAGVSTLVLPAAVTVVVNSLFHRRPASPPTTPCSARSATSPGVAAWIAGAWLAGRLVDLLLRRAAVTGLRSAPDRRGSRVQRVGLTLDFAKNFGPSRVGLAARPT